MRRFGIGVVVLAIALVFVGGSTLLAEPTTSEIAPHDDPDPELFRPTAGESGVWPYLNSRKAFRQRSPINVIVVAETDETVRLLTESRAGDWEETDGDLAEADPETHAIAADDDPDGDEGVVDGGVELGSTRIAWSRTTGATRYAYVDSGDGGRWVAETAQLHDGTYYGHRYHVRLYESPHPAERWVAMQTHSEHFDWFTLRHRVHGSQAAQTHLERDLAALPRVDLQRDVRRVNLENGNAKDADGWATLVDLAGVVLAGVAVGLSVTGSLGRLATGIDERLGEADRRRIDAARERLDARYAVLGGTILGLVLGVRAGGVALERSGILGMHAIAGALYPFVALGLPAGTYLIARRFERRFDAAAVAGGSLAAAFWLDYGLLGIATLPVDVILQRTLVVVALGMIAGGAAGRRTPDSASNTVVLTGIVLWALLLAGTLFGYV